MNFIEKEIVQHRKVTVKNLLPEIGSEQLRHEILTGLSAENAFISSKFFYDVIGSRLFEEITQLPEYYPTRTEKNILREIAPELMNRNSSFEIMELGSGDCSKVSILLKGVANNNLENLKYIPIDFSKSAIEDSVNQLSEKFFQLQVEGYVADFIHQTNLIPHSEKKRIICFLGSTIGNFEQKEAKQILKNISRGLRRGDSLIVGFDLEKKRSVLHAAYNDAMGITERFNKNILNVVNRIIHSDFNLNDFNHNAFFNKEKSRIEMHLIANKDCKINSPFFEKPLFFVKGDYIHTENSHKYSFDSIRELIVDSGLSIKNTFVDSKKWFVLVEFEI